MSSIPAVPAPLPAVTDTAPARTQPASSLTELIDDAIVQADAQRAQLAAAGDLPALAHGLAALRDVTKKLQILIAQTDGDVSLLNKQAGNNQIIPDLGILETKRRSTRTRWDSDRLWSRLVDAITALAVIDPETGEMTGDRNTAARCKMLLDEVLKPTIGLTASAPWRTTGLKAAGIDPNTYREQERGPDTTRIL